MNNGIFRFGDRVTLDATRYPLWQDRVGVVTRESRLFGDGKKSYMVAVTFEGLYHEVTVRADYVSLANPPGPALLQTEGTR